MKNKIKSLKFKRRRKGKTNYSKRLLLLKSHKPRVVVRKNLKTITIQMVQYDSKGDKIICSINSNTLKKYGWNYNCANTPSSYLTGLIMAKILQKKGLREGIIDMGIITSIKGNKIYSAIKGLIDGGLKLPIDEKMFPSNERLKGEHIKKYSKEIEESEKTQFSNYLKNKTSPKSITEIFEKTKSKILSEI